MNTKKLEELVRLGFSSRKIAKNLGVSQSSVRYWLNKLGKSTKFKRRPRGFSEQEITEAVQKSISLAECLRRLQQSIVGANYKWLRKQIVDLQLNTEHFKGQKHGTSIQKGKVPYSELLTKNSKHRISKLRKKSLIKDGLLQNVCQICMMKPTWNEKPLILRLDHINGNSYDNRLQNLRLVCPNCDSQLPTFCGRNIKNKHRRPTE